MMRDDDECKHENEDVTCSILGKTPQTWTCTLHEHSIFHGP